MKEIFDSYVENAFDGYEQAAFKFKQFENNYKKYFPLDKKAKLLDIGIGRGEMLTCMKNWDYLDYIGVDISPSTVQFCSSLNLNCELTEDTRNWLNNHANSFDLITLLDVLEHIKKDEVILFIEALRVAMKDGGVLLVQVPNMQSPDSQLHRYNDITHEIGFGEHSLRQVLLAGGFKNIQFHGFEHIVSNNYSKYVWLILRKMYTRYVRYTRRVMGNLDPAIISPVFFAIVAK